MSELRPKADPTRFTHWATKRWIAETEFPLRYALAPGFFDSVFHSGLSVDDRIDLIACGDNPASHVVLLVDSIGNEPGGRVTVSAAHEFRRTAP